MALAIFVQYTAAVAHCHERGVIHRDIKLTNIYCDARSSSAATASDSLGAAHWELGLGLGLANPHPHPHPNPTPHPNPSPDPNQVMELPGHRDAVTSLAVSRSSSAAEPNPELFSASADRCVKVWNFQRRATMIETLFGHQEGITALDAVQSDVVLSSA